MTSTNLLRRLATTEQLATSSRLYRLWNNPVRYISTIYFKEKIYPKTKTELKKKCTLFTGDEMNIVLPAATDIYLTGGKSHDSEIRLAKFMIHQLQPENCFLDIGAHYGYFSMIASKIVGKNGKVLAIEAAPNTYMVLAENSLQHDNIQSVNKAVSNNEEPIKFFQFPNQYSEYNTTDISQFENEEWYKDNQAEELTISTTTLDKIYSDILKNKLPNMIKIDVEGAEHKVIMGGIESLKKHNPIIIMEYLCDERSNESHIKAEQALTSIGYKTYCIDKDGFLFPISAISDYLRSHKMESDNIVFTKEH